MVKELQGEADGHVDVVLNKARIVSRFVLATFFYATADRIWSLPYGFTNVTEEKKLGNRTTSALDFLLQYKQISYILDALMQLG